MKCIICGEEISNPKAKKYCSIKCNNKYNNAKAYALRGAEYQREKNRIKREQDTRPKIKCEICGQSFRQVGSHITQVHNMTAKEYRKQFGFDSKRGQLPEDLRQLKKEICIENETIKNLEKGAAFRFKKGDKVGKYERSEETMKRLKQSSFIKKSV